MGWQRCSNVSTCFFYKVNSNFFYFFYWCSLVLKWVKMFYCYSVLCLVSLGRCNNIVCPGVVYFDQFLGAARTQNLVELLFFSRF